MNRKPRILGAAIGDCVHVAGVVNFLHLAEAQGYETFCLGPAVSVDELLGAALEDDPDIIAVGYRLTPETGARVLAELKDKAERMGLAGKRFVFGGVGAVCEHARRLGLFEAVFDADTTVDEIIAYLRGGPSRRDETDYPQTLVERIEFKHPYPVIRHHFGLPSVEETIRGVAEIAEARCLDVISLGTDQNAQEHFFRPEEMDPDQHGAGGVPVRTPDDLRAIYQASRRGNYPLMRCYSGTRDTLKWAEMLKETINNAWCAVPLFWYSQLDGRSQRPLDQSIAEAQELMRWHARHGIPVEMNESHHWSLRDAHDTVAVVAAFLAAYNAKQAGVRTYVQQLMFNNPPGTSFKMDLAKMLAKLELVGELEGDDFRVLRETRTGLSSYPADLDRAKGQIASSVLVQMALRPHIVHVVAYTEASHAATARDVIASCRIAEQAIRNAVYGLPDMLRDPDIEERKRQLVAEARELLAAIRSLAAPGVRDPWTDPATLKQTVEIGLLDAPHLMGNKAARGRVRTKIINGACYAIDPATGRPLTERERIDRVLAEYEEEMKASSPA
ncbi:MAG TPA: methionine synthase [Thermaerobacter sp.]